MSDRPPRRQLVLGSRGSALARIQATRVADALRDAWPGIDVETRWITTTGDRVLDEPLPEIGGKGVFTAELEVALLDGEIDAAVHSLKDLPTDLGEGFRVLGVPEREDPRDVLVGPGGPMRLEDLSTDAVVGTSSLRRAAQLLARCPGCRVEDVRGNVETRVEKMREGEYDAVVLAAAGLLRLGMLDPERAIFLEPPEWLPAPGQGALAVEGRDGDAATRSIVARVERPELRSAVEAERGLLAELEGGCLVPIGAWARLEGGELRLDAVVLSPDGGRELRARGSVAFDPAGEDASESYRSAAGLGRRVARDLIEQGADRILDRLEERA